MDACQEEEEDVCGMTLIYSFDALHNIREFLIYLLWFWRIKSFPPILSFIFVFHFGFEVELISTHTKSQMPRPIEYVCVYFEFVRVKTRVFSSDYFSVIVELVACMIAFKAHPLLTVLSSCKIFLLVSLLDK